MQDICTQMPKTRCINCVEGGCQTVTNFWGEGMVYEYVTNPSYVVVQGQARTVHMHWMWGTT